MDSARVGALFFQTIEDLVGASDLLLTMELREALDERALVRAYERQVRARSTLRSRLRLEPVDKGHGWERLDDEQLQPLLAQQLICMTSAEPETPEVFHPINSVLPYRVRLVEPRRLEVRISHLLTNGQGLLFWGDDLLSWLGDAPAELAAAPARPAGWRRAAQVCRETFWSLAWIRSFLKQVKRDGPTKIVDLSDGRPGLPMVRGFARMRRVLSEEQSRTLVAAAREAGRSVTSMMLSALSAEWLGRRPAADQVSVVMPADLLASRPGVSRSDPGNHTGGMVARLKRADVRGGAGAASPDSASPDGASDISGAQDLAAQADGALRWFHRGVPAGATRLADMPLKDEQQFREQLRAGAGKPLVDRGPFESSSCVMSNLGARREFARLNEACVWASATSFGQPPILTALAISGRVAIELTVSLDLFERAEMESVLEGFVERLLGSSL
ncbi:MAG: hypothetical protein ACI9EF_001518 [Pseudohongiellaceae bacterium]|jgi:hypothetical protein